MRSERSGWRRFGVGLAGAVVVMAGACVSFRGGEVRAQQGSGTATRPTEPATIEPPALGSTDNPMKEQMQIAAVGERHKRMVADSDKLLELATELKAEVEKSTKNEMSVSAIKKAAEIEKLARDVKDRMKGE